MPLRLASDCTGLEQMGQWQPICWTLSTYLVNRMNLLLERDISLNKKRVLSVLSCVFVRALSTAKIKGSEIDPHGRSHLKMAKRLGHGPRKLHKQAGRGAEMDIDCYCCGFPCQAHSTAGKRAGTSDSRDLSGTISDWVVKHQPKVFILEQVPGIAAGRMKAGWDIHCH